MSRLVDSQAVADHLGLPNKSWVEEQARQNRIPHVRLGHYVRYDLERIDEWWQGLAQEPIGPPAKRRV